MIDTKHMAFPKPSAIRRPKIDGGVRIYPNGREVCEDSSAGKLEYARRRKEMADRQGGHCFYCGIHLTVHNTTFDHWAGRGHGGGKRDDRIVKDGKPHNCAACRSCNTEKGSRSLEEYLRFRKEKGKIVCFSSELTPV